jgi:soluble P-type ATPase
MGKPGIEITIPFFATPLLIKRIVSDYTGTLSFNRKLIRGVGDRLRSLSERVDIYVLSADSSGTASDELAGLPLTLEIYKYPGRHNVLKQIHAEQNNPSRIAAFGNGNNDELLLKTVREAGGLAVAVDNGEGCSVLAMQNANIFIGGIVNALDLLLHPTRCKATLRR